MNKSLSNSKQKNNIKQEALGVPSMRGHEEPDISLQPSSENQDVHIFHLHNLLFLQLSAVEHISHILDHIWFHG